MQNNWKKDILLTLIIATVVTLILFLILIASYAVPIADQFGFINNFTRDGVIGNTINMYTNWSGRLLQALGIGISYVIFGANRAQVVVPILFLIMLGLVCSWLFNLLIDFKNKKFLPFIFGFLVAGGILYTTYCLFDIYLWLDSAFVYLFGMIALIFDIDVFIWIIRAKNICNVKTFVLLFFVMIGQTIGETTMALVLGWTTIFLIGACIVKKFHIYRKPILWFFIAVVFGSSIMILSPGLWSRANYITQNVTEMKFIDVFVKCPLNAYQQLLSSFDIWQIALVLMTIFGVAPFVKEYINKKNFKYYIFASLLCALSFTYITFVVYFYASKEFGVESRVMTTASLGIYAGAILAGITLFSLWLKELKNPFLVSVIFYAILLIPFGIGFLKYNNSLISVVATRKNEFITRVTMIQKFQMGQNDDSKKLIVNDIPVMLERSGATDFTGNGWNAVEWYYDSFITYYNIPNNQLVVNGNKLIQPENSASWYNEVEQQIICVPQSTIVLEKYWCNK